MWERRRQHPLLQLRLFSRRVFRTSSTVLFGIQFGMVSVTVFGAMWLQNVAGLSPLDAGLALLPLIVPLIASSQVAGRVFDRRGPRGLVTVGGGITALGLAATVPGLPMQSYLPLVPAFVLLGLGTGLVMSPVTTAALGGVRASERAQASGISATIRQAGGAVGVALIGGVVHVVDNWHITASVRASDAVQASLSTATAVGFVLGAFAVAIVSLIAWHGYRSTASSEIVPALALATAH
jgi:predicted MFS family arabinose efflux permease